MTYKKRDIGNRRRRRRRRRGRNRRRTKTRRGTRVGRSRTTHGEKYVKHKEGKEELAYKTGDRGNRKRRSG